MRRTRLALYVIGTAVLTYGVIGLFIADRGPSPVAWGRFWVGGLLAHDLVIAPLLVVLGVLVVRLVPGRPRPYVQAGLAISAMVSLLALPFVLGRGRAEGEPSALPLDYGRGSADQVGNRLGRHGRRRLATRPTRERARTGLMTRGVITVAFESGYIQATLLRRRIPARKTSL